MITEAAAKDNIKVFRRRMVDLESAAIEEIKSGRHSSALYFLGQVIMTQAKLDAWERILDQARSA